MDWRMYYHLDCSSMRKAREKARDISFQAQGRMFLRLFFIFEKKNAD